MPEDSDRQQGSQLGEMVISFPEDEACEDTVYRLRSALLELKRLQGHLRTIERPSVRESVLESICNEIRSVIAGASELGDKLSPDVHVVARQQLSIAEEELRETRVTAGRVVAPQVFRAGDPVDRQREAFVPRYSVIGSLQRQVMASTGCPGIVLYGRRRTGKTTVLRNLEGFVPPAICVVIVSMQNPRAFSSLASFVDYLTEGILDSRCELRPVIARATSLKNLFACLTGWNELLAQSGRRLIIALDEYENLDEKIGAGVFNEDLLATFRESIQCHRQITWVFSGSSGINELKGAPWTSYFVSLKTIEVPLFTIDETRLLLTDPLKYSNEWKTKSKHRPRFSPRFWGTRGIERIHAEAGGWPHLVQLIAESLIDFINDQPDQKVTEHVIDRALDLAAECGHNVLYQLFEGENSTQGEREYLRGFRYRDEQQPPHDPSIASSLQRRLLVTVDQDKWRLKVPLMLRWLRGQQ